jgi:hypothetical protein
MPPVSQRGEWGYYINGYPRRKVVPPAATYGKGKGKGKAVESDEEEGVNGITGEETIEAVDDMHSQSDGDDMDLELEDEEEAAMNLPPAEEVMEPLSEKHKARYPLICILQRLDTVSQARAANSRPVAHPHRSKLSRSSRP